MSGRPPALERYAEATEPTADAVDRAVGRVLAQVDPPMLRSLPPPQEPRPRAWTAWVGALVLGAVALGIVLSIERGAPDRSLGSLAEWSEAEIGPGVSARFMGEGQVRGEVSPAITWRTGTLELAVDPQAGQSVRVQTLEAEVRVVGTLFTVERSALGTRVSVSHGVVEVTCSGGGPGRVTSGGTRTCLPITGAGMLGRARVLEERGAASGEVLAAVEAGLALAEGPVAGELRAFRIQHLIRTGAHGRARAAIDEYLALGTVLRRSQMLRAGARLAGGDCAAVRGYLERLPEGERTSEDLERAAGCSPR